MIIEDYHVSSLLKNWQMGTVYGNFYEMVADVKTWIISKYCSSFFQLIDLVTNKLEAVIEIEV